MPLAVARESSVRLIDDAIANGKLIAVFTQRDAAVEEPGQDDLYTGRHGHAHPQDVQAARRQPAADRPGAGAADARRGRRRRSRTCARASTRPSRVRSDADRLEIDALARNIKTNFQQVVSLSPLLVRRSADAGDEHHRARPARRLHRLVAVDDQHGREAGSARDARHPRADGQPEPHPDQGARGARARLEDPVAGAVRGRQEPARVLPARADEGDSEGARRGRRPDQGDRGARREDRSGGHARAGEEGSAPRARSAVEDAGRRRRIHRLADVSRLARRAAVEQAHRRSDRSAARPRACSTPTTPASRRRRIASSSTSPCAS